MISEAVKIEWNCRKAQFYLVSTPPSGGGGNSPCSTSKAVKSKLATWGGNSNKTAWDNEPITLLPMQGGNS